ncbi:MAG: hypothetical protein WC670_09905 [Pseudolabrys sp.]
MSGRDGLGLSVAIYMAAITATLAVIAVPVYLAAAPRVYENPPIPPLDPLLNGPIVGGRVSTPMALARLKREVIVDPAEVAALDARSGARSKDAGPKRRLTAQHTVHLERGTPVAALPPQRERPSSFFFGLFGG